MVRGLVWPLAIGVAACTSSVPSVTPGAAPAAGPEASAGAGAELLGHPAPAWTAERWLHSRPLTLASLRGKVVFARWWTAGCPYCAASAPVLRDLDARYGPRGLVVIGFYHHKEDSPFDPAVYETTARDYGFTFPLAFDPQWTTLKAWWLSGHDRDFTSASFLIDKAGRFRWVHPGGTLPAGGDAARGMQAAIEAALAE